MRPVDDLRSAVLPQPRGARPPRRAGHRGRRVRRPRRVDPLDGAGGARADGRHTDRGGTAHLHHPRRTRGRRARHPARAARTSTPCAGRVGAARRRRATEVGVAMDYVSTRGDAPVLGFADVLLAGLAADGGLYVPERWPALPPLDDLRGRRLRRGRRRGHVALRRGRPVRPRPVVRAASSPRATPPSTHPRCAPSCRSAAPIRCQLSLLELFRGPTLAFKDVALQLVGRLFDHVLTERRRPGLRPRRHLGRHRLGSHGRRAPVWSTSTSSSCSPTGGSPRCSAAR